MNKKIYLTMIVAGLVSCAECQAQSNRPVQTFPASLATNDPQDFILRADGKYIWNTNTDRYWRSGVWKEMTNGWRVRLYVSTNTSSLSDIGVGSLITNSGGGYWEPPYGKFAKFELLDSDGKMMQPKPDAGTNLLKWYTHNQAYNTNTHTWYEQGWADQTNVPAWASPTNESLAVDFPETASAKDYPHFGKSIGSIVGAFNFSRGEPSAISRFVLGDLYSITNEGDYTLTVQPVLYRYQFYVGTNGGIDVLKTNHSEILRRVDLPSVTTKIHLKPSQ